MNPIVKNILRFLIFVLVQGLILGKLEIGFGIHPMIYPLFIMLLPFDMGIVWVMIVAFFTGLSVDFFMNTFGLHASAAVLIAYIRPELFKLFSPRDGYESFTEGNINQMGYQWFFSVFGILTVIHHLYFFFLEQFKFTEILYVFQQTILSAILTIIFAILIQVIFFKKIKKS